MKFSLRLGDAHHITRDNAWACCSANLVLPGFGSLMAGRKAGYVQAVLGVAGFFLTTVFGIKFVIWGVQHWSEIHNPEGDPIETLTALWHACRWALLGMLLFGLSWVWALITSWGILRGAKRQAERGNPPLPK
jgi:hypothetical protein